MFEADEEECLPQFCEKNVLWFVYVLLLLREGMSPDTGIEYNSHKNMSRKNCCPNHDLKMMFVQMYKI